MQSKETCRPAWADKDEPLISYGLPFPKTCRKHIDSTFKASKVYIISSGSLARETSNLADLQNELGDKVAGIRIGMKPHTFMSEVLDVVRDARKVDADLIVSIGGGSVTDAAKLVAFVSCRPCSRLMWAKVGSDGVSLGVRQRRTDRTRPPEAPTRVRSAHQGQSAQMSSPQHPNLAFRRRVLRLRRCNQRQRPSEIPVQFPPQRTPTDCSGHKSCPEHTHQSLDRLGRARNRPLRRRLLRS